MDVPLNDTTPPVQVPPTEQMPGTGAADDLAAFTKDFERLQKQKARPTGGIEPRTLLNLSFYNAEHNTIYSNKQIIAEPLDPNKLHLVFNLIGQRVDKLIGRLSSTGGTFKAVPDRRDPKAFAEADIVDRLIKALDQKVDQPSRMREILFWQCIGGTAFEYIPWVSNASLEPMPQYGDPSPEAQTGELLYKDSLQLGPDGQPAIVPQSVVDQQVQAGRPPESFEPYETVEEVGDVGSEVFGPLNVFLDQGVKSVDSLAPDQAIYIAFIKTHGWIEENYPGKTQALEPDTTIQIVTTKFTQSDNASVAGMSLKDLIPVVQGSRSEDDPPMNMVVERYQPASSKNPHGRFTCFIPGKLFLHDGPIPYDDGIPVVDYHFRPVTTTFWTKDYVTDLIAPQRFLNKRMSQLGEQANASIYDKILLGPGLTEKDIPADYPGVVKNGLTDQGQPQVARLAGPQLPSWFLTSIDITTKMFNDIAGGSDLFQEHQFPGQLRGPMAVPMLQEILDTEWGPFYDHLGERLARAKQMRLNRVKQFYPPERTMHYMDRTQKDEVFEFHTDEILKNGTTFNVTIERGSLVPELRALREARIRERLASPLSVLYLDQRTGQLDKSKIAEDLQFGDIGREGQEAQYRKLGAEIVGRLWRGEPLPPVLPFYNHAVMMDELESAMATTEFLSVSQPIQQLFFARWQQHQAFMQQAAAAQASAMQSQQMQGAVAQATQQAAAEAAAETVKASLGQLQAQVQGASGVPTMLHEAFSARKDPA